MWPVMISIEKSWTGRVTLKIQQSHFGGNAVFEALGINPALNAALEFRHLI